MPEWLINELSGTWFSLLYLLLASAVSMVVVAVYFFKNFFR